MISAIIERLEATRIFAGVELAEDLDAMMRGTGKANGTLFVMPYREMATQNSLSTGFRQKIDVQIVTAFILRRQDDPRGARRAASFDRFKAAVEQALAGWEPPGMAAPLELIGGEGSSLGDNVSIYAQTWETNRYLTGEAQ